MMADLVDSYFYFQTRAKFVQGVCSLYVSRVHVHGLQYMYTVWHALSTYTRMCNDVVVTACPCLVLTLKLYLKVNMVEIRYILNNLVGNWGHSVDRNAQILGAQIREVRVYPFGFHVGQANTAVTGSAVAIVLHEG